MLGLLDVGWEAPAPVLAGCLVALGLFGQAFWRLRQRGRTDHAGWDRAALFVLAVALTFLALASPLDGLGDRYLLSAHMLQHVAIGDLAPVLGLLALRGPLTFFLLPAPLLSVGLTSAIDGLGRALRIPASSRTRARIRRALADLTATPARLIARTVRGERCDAIVV